MTRSLLSRNLVVGCLGAALAVVIGLFLGRGDFASGLQLLLIAVAVLAAVMVPARYLILAVIVLLPFEFFTERLPVRLPMNLVPADMALIAYALAAVIRRLARPLAAPFRRARSTVVVAGVFAVLLLLVGGLSSWDAGFSLAAARKLGRVAVMLLAIWGTPAALGEKDVERGARAFVVMGALVSCYAIVEGILAVAGVHTSIWQFIGPMPRLSGGFGDPNFFAYFLALVVPLALARLVLADRPRLWSFFALIALVVAAVGTFSRGGVIGLLGGVIVVIAVPLVRGRGRSLSRAGRSVSVIGSIAVLGGIVAASIPAIWSVVYERFASAAQLSADPTAILRLRIWRTSLELLKGSPTLGIGPGNFLERMGEINPDTAFYAHNSLLEATVEMGVLGGAILFGIGILLLAASFSAVWRLVGSGSGAHLSDGTIVGLLGSVVAGFIASFFLSNALFLPGLASVLILLSVVWRIRTPQSAGGPPFR